MLNNKCKIQATSSMKSSAFSVYSGLSQISEIEKAILSKDHFPLDLTDNQDSNTDKNIWINKSSTSKWDGPIPLHDYPLYDDPEPHIVLKKTKESINYVQEFAIR